MPAPRPEGITRALESVRIDMELKGFVFVSEVKPRANMNCPCKSGRKFKRCCIPNIVRAGGATWLKPNASADTRRA